VKVTQRSGKLALVLVASVVGGYSITASFFRWPTIFGQHRQSIANIVSELVLIWTIVWSVWLCAGLNAKQWHISKSVKHSVIGLPILLGGMSAVARLHSKWVEISAIKQMVSSPWILAVIPAILSMGVGILGAMTLSRVDRAVRKARAKLKENSCRKCDYNLRGNVSGICPECGTPTKETNGESASTE
jgi:hypothetical protein